MSEPSLGSLYTEWINLDILKVPLDYASQYE